MYLIGIVTVYGHCLRSLLSLFLASIVIVVVVVVVVVVLVLVLVLVVVVVVVVVVVTVTVRGHYSYFSMLVLSMFPSLVAFDVNYHCCCDYGCCCKCYYYSYCDSDCDDAL